MHLEDVNAGIQHMCRWYFHDTEHRGLHVTCRCASHSADEELRPKCAPESIVVRHMLRRLSAQGVGRYSDVPR